MKCSVSRFLTLSQNGASESLLPAAPTEARRPRGKPICPSLTSLGREPTRHYMSLPIVKQITFVGGTLSHFFEVNSVIVLIGPRQTVKDERSIRKNKF